MAGRKPVIVKNKEPKKKEMHRCGDCGNVTPVTSPRHLLSVRGEPILGICPYWTESRCVLLSWRCICDHWVDPNKPIQQKEESQ